MKYLSLFSGIGGFEKGIIQSYEETTHYKSKNAELRAKGNISGNNGNKLQRTPPCCVGYSEIDKYAIKIYEKHFPKHKNYGDIRAINASELPNFDLLIGGFPCQSFSIAGKRKGFDDTRGTLFFEIARLLKAKQPRLLLLENVKGLLSHNDGRTFRTIISTLDELGYDLQWQVLNSKNFGVPQNRERVFIVGHIRGTSRPQVFPITEGNQNINKTNKENSSIYTPSITTQGGKNCRGMFIKQLNNPKHSNNRIYEDTGISPTLNTMQGGLRQPFIAKTIRSGGIKSPHGSKQNWDSYEIEGKIRRLTPTECERLQGFPDNWTKGLSDTQRYKTLGNAVTVNVIQAIMNKIR